MWYGEALKNCWCTKISMFVHTLISQFLNTDLVHAKTNTRAPNTDVTSFLNENTISISATNILHIFICMIRFLH